MEYTVTFYQCGVTGIEPESYSTLKQARAAVSSFLSEFKNYSGLKRVGSIARGDAKIVDPMGLTEALANIATTGV